MKTRMLFVLLLPFFILTACVSEHPPRLSVGTNQWPGYETLHLANHFGLYDHHEIKLVELTSATDVINAFRLGHLDVAALTLDEVITVSSQVPDVVVFLVMDISNGADKVIAAPSITSASELVGKKVGVEKTAVGALMFREFLNYTGLNAEDLVVIPSTVDQHASMMANHKLDAVVTFSPVSNELLASGHVSLFDSSQIPGMIVDVLVTRKTTLENKFSSLKKLVEAQWQALDYLSTKPEEAASIMAPRLKLSPEALLQTYQELILPDQKQNQALLGSELKQTAARLNQIMYDTQITRKMVNAERLITDRMVK